MTIVSIKGLHGAGVMDPCNFICMASFVLQCYDASGIHTVILTITLRSACEFNGFV